MISGRVAGPLRDPPAQLARFGITPGQLKIVNGSGMKVLTAMSPAFDA